MRDGRGVRLALEVALLVALAVVLGLSDVRPLVIVAVMAVAWLVVAAVEWVSWREVPHYGTGSPPRYYVPPVRLPPPRPIEQSRSGSYPGPRSTEAPTWIAPPEARRATVSGWPAVASPPEARPPAAPSATVPEFAPAGAADDPWRVEALPAEPVASGPVRLAKHHLDPFAETVPRRRLWQRRLQDSGSEVELPALPRHPRLRRR